MGTAWALANSRCLSVMLIRVARLSNRATDRTDRDTTADMETFRDLGLALVGRPDLTVEWDGLLSAVENLDMYRADPAACETWTEESIEDDLALAVFGLLYPGQAPCWLCRALVGGRDEVPASVWWNAEGSCPRHTPTAVVADPWQQAVA
jgi:hypothetical protein